MKMKKGWLLLVIVFAFSAVQAFTGAVKVDYENGKAKAHVDIFFKGDSVYIKQTLGGLEKYDHFLLNLKTGELITVSNADKKTAIKYDLNKLIDYYDANNLKKGYTKNYGITYKFNEKTGTYTGEKSGVKVSVNVQETNTPLNEIIPLLRLLGNWNEADGTTFKNTIIKSESEGKEGNKQSVNVVVTNENYTGKPFSVPANYTLKDFIAIMEEKKNTEELKTIIQAFAGF
jgi:hypothetical protein